MLQKTGSISLSDIAHEFGGDAPHSLVEYYRGGGRVPDIPINSHIPKSGLISLTNFYGAANWVTHHVTANANHFDAKSLFQTDWGQNIPKKLIIDSGLTIGTLTIPIGMNGELHIENHGEIQGYGGTPSHRNGTDAIIVNSNNIIIDNLGTLRAGGGMGGDGGAGGQGRYTTPITIREPSTGYASSRDSYATRDSDDPDLVFRWNNQHVVQHQDGWTYYTGRVVGGDAQLGSGHEYRWQKLEIYRVKHTTTTHNTNGGIGGRGGNGRGYNQSIGNGYIGHQGGKNAGTGGHGGHGGDWGGIGETGHHGLNGNRSNGLSGQSGGQPGLAIRKNGHTVTLLTHGHIIGGVH